MMDLDTTAGAGARIGFRTFSRPQLRTGITPVPLRHPARWLWLLLCMAALAQLAPAARAAAFGLYEGDRIALVGAGFVEQEAEDGYIETVFLRRYPTLKLTFRNLGWSGDTVNRQTRPPKWTNLLEDTLTEFKPTVIFVGYGLMESFAGKPGLSKYMADFEAVIKRMEKHTTRIVILSPPRHENLGGLWPEPVEHNGSLQLYVLGMRRIAKLRGHSLVNYYELLGDGLRSRLLHPYTHNGIHLTRYGCWRASAVTEQALGLFPLNWRVELDPANKLNPIRGTQLKELRQTTNSVRFTTADEALPAPLPPPDAPEGAAWGGGLGRVLRVAGLAPGNYLLKIDGQPVARSNAETWAVGVALTRGPEFDQAEELRGAVVAKNREFFHRYRPQNYEYLFGTRRQDNLAAELPGFDEQVARKEKEIDRLKVPVPHVYELVTDTGEPLVATKRLSLATGRSLANDPAAPDPEVERRTFQVADGFEVNLFAADPLIAKPLQMNFDEQGRLWVATTTLYPQIKPGQVPDDKIVVLEDKDGDGRADKTTVFADHLLIPTGVLPANGGVYAFSDTRVLFLRDTDGDGRADHQEVVLSGLGTEDTHHMAHLFRWGPGGNLYFNQGIFLHSTIETPYGIVQQAGDQKAGIFEYHPASGRLNVFLANSHPPNPWGHLINRWGWHFDSETSGSLGTNLILPTGNQTGSDILVPGGESDKHCGPELLSGRHLPDDWQGSLLSNQFKQNRVVRWTFSDDGSGFALKAMPPLIASTDRAFRPIETRMGPDGAIYIADWFSPIIDHTRPFRGAGADYKGRPPTDGEYGRDLTHGRIWRVTAKGRALVSRPKLTGVPVSEILNHLKAPEDFTRLQAKRALAACSNQTEVLTALGDWVHNLDPDAPHYDHHRMEALWAYQTLNTPEPDLLRSVLRARDFNARAAATLLLRYWHPQISGALDLLAAQVTDDQPRVRLAAVITLSHIPTARAMELAAMAIDRPMDPYLAQALNSAANALKDSWLPAVDRGELTFDNNARRLAFALQAVGSRNAARPLFRLLAAGHLSLPDRESALEQIARLGGPDDLVRLFNGKYEPALQAKVLDALTHAAAAGQSRPKVDFGRLQVWLKHPDESVRLAALRLAGQWRLEQFRSTMTGLAARPETKAHVREAAVEALVSLGGKTSQEFLVKLAQPNQPNTVRMAAVKGLAELDVSLAAPLAAKVLALPVEGIHPAPIVQAFLGRKGGADALAVALAANPIPQDNAKLSLRAIQAAGGQYESLARVLNEAAGFHAEFKPLTPAELQQRMAEVTTKGEAARGEAVFRRASLGCLQCHAVAGAGGQIGPDLSGLGTSATLDYILESILEPSKAVKEGYDTVEVTTKEDDYLMGIKVRETPQELVLRNATSTELAIPLHHIKLRQIKPVSIMPSGLADTLTQGEFLDLCRFLYELGKPGLYASSVKSYLRRWRVLDPLPAELATVNLEQLAAALENHDRLHWMPAYSLVSGLLPLEAFTPAACQSIALLRGEIEVTTPGAVRLNLNSTRGLELCVDDKPVEARETLVLDLAYGMHKLTFRINLAQRGQAGMLVELAEVAESPARAHLVGGY